MYAPQQYVNAYATPYATPYAVPTAVSNPANVEKSKDQLNSLLGDIQSFIDSFGNPEASAKYAESLPAINKAFDNSVAAAEGIPGTVQRQPTPDAEFASFRDRQNKIFAATSDLGAQLAGL